MNFFAKSTNSIHSQSRYTAQLLVYFIASVEWIQSNVSRARDTAHAKIKAFQAVSCIFTEFRDLEGKKLRRSTWQPEITTKWKTSNEFCCSVHCSVEVDLIRILQVLMANITSSYGNDITQAASAKLFARIHHEGLLHVIGSHHESWPWKLIDMPSLLDCTLWAMSYMRP